MNLSGPTDKQIKTQMQAYINRVPQTHTYYMFWWMQIDYCIEQCQFA